VAVRSHQSAASTYKKAERRVLAAPLKPSARPATPNVVAKAAPAAGGNDNWESF